MARLENAIIEGIEGLEGRIFACIPAPPGYTRRGKAISKICYPRQYASIKPELLKGKRIFVAKVEPRPPRKPTPYAECVAREMRAKDLKGKGKTKSEIRDAFKSAVAACRGLTSKAKKRGKK